MSFMDAGSAGGLVLFIGLVLLAEARREARRRRLTRMLAYGGADPEVRVDVRAGDPGMVRPGTRGWLMTLAAAAIAASLLLPGVPADGSGPLPGRGRLVLVLDVSRSMTVADVAPDRMTQARTAAYRLTTELSGAAVGLVAFASHAYPLLPPTHDRGLLLRYLEALDPRMLSAQGSRLSVAIDAALEELGGREAVVAPSGSSAIVLITDGESFDSDARVAAALERARARGVALYAVGVGTPEGGLVPGAGAISTARPARLAALLAAAGGSAADAGHASEMTAVARDLHARFAQPLQRRGPARAQRLHPAGWFAGLALLALVLEAALALRPRRTQRRFDERRADPRAVPFGGPYRTRAA